LHAVIHLAEPSTRALLVVELYVITNAGIELAQFLRRHLVGELSPQRRGERGLLGPSAASEARLYDSPQRPAARPGVVLGPFRSSAAAQA